ncbi:MAG: tetratricopeptide repeat protein [Alphaproteobacteria bacterium]|nr:tetratricopeptide repeat protein [Alphaproteobacteria bacterium]
MNDQLATAFQWHQTGRLIEAEAVYRAVAAQAPERADVRFLLGVLLVQTGRAGEAESFLTRVLALSPGHADAAYNLGVARQAIGNFRGAVAAYRLALRLGASYLDVRLNLGAALQEMGQFAEGEIAYMEALAQKPGDPGILGNLAQLLKATGRQEEALAAFDVALSGAPTRLDLHLGRASVLKELGRLEEALAALDGALRLDPNCAEAHNNRGVLLNDLGRFDLAGDAFKEALACKPTYAEAAGNLGNVLLGAGRLDEALKAYDQALDQKPELATARFNRGFARLLCGDYAGGWPDWEARFGLADMQGFHLDGPVWDGLPNLSGPLLVQAEQGFGDTIHFLRYVPLLAATGIQVIVRCQDSLVPLIRRSFAGLAEVIAQSDPPPAYAAWVAVASLGHKLGTRLETIPASIPYLIADAERVTAWAKRLSGAQKPKLGLVWRGNPGFKGEARRAPGLTPLKRMILNNPQVRWLSLQRDPARQEMFSLGLGGLLEDLGDGDDPLVGQGFDSTAALLKNVDLLICSDTAVAHLAGALGVECWVMLSSAPDWRWGRAGEGTPWYPTLKLFRQPAPEDWAGVADRLDIAIRARFPDSPAP